MNKIWIIGLVAAVLVVIGGAWVITGGNFNFATMNNTSLRTLLASGQSQKCTFTNDQSSGTIYVGAGKMRGDFTSKMGEATAQSHMVVSNDLVYVWIDGQAQGFRMSFEDLKPGGAGGGSSQIDADAKVATNCTPWQATESSFELPANITFNALPGTGAQTQTQTQTNTETGDAANIQAEGSAGGQMDYYAQQCAACSMIEDAEGKAQCQATFDCP